MKTKIILIGISLLLLALSITFIVLYTKQGNDLLRANTNAVDIQKEYQDKEGRWVKEIVAKENTISEWKYKASLGDSTILFMQHQLDVMGIKLRKVENIGVLGFSVSDSLISKIRLILSDSIKAQYAAIYKLWRDNIKDSTHFQNTYWECDYVKQFNTDNASLECTYLDSLLWAVSIQKMGKWKFKNLWQPRYKAAKLDAKFFNPKARIKFAEYYTIKK